MGTRADTRGVKGMNANTESDLYQIGSRVRMGAGIGITEANMWRRGRVTSHWSITWYKRNQGKMLKRIRNAMAITL